MTASVNLVALYGEKYAVKSARDAEELRLEKLFMRYMCRYLNADTMDSVMLSLHGAKTDSFDSGWLRRPTHTLAYALFLRFYEKYPSASYIVEYADFGRESIESFVNLMYRRYNFKGIESRYSPYIVRGIVHMLHGEKDAKKIKTCRAIGDLLSQVSDMHHYMHAELGAHKLNKKIKKRHHHLIPEPWLDFYNHKISIVDAKWDALGDS